MNEQDRATVAALLTPPGRGAVASIGVDGPGAVLRIDTLFFPASGKPVAEQPCDKILFGRWASPQGEELVVCRRSEQHVEIHCHGGDQAPAAILQALSARGVQVVDWQTWIRRHEKDPWAADARIALADARTERTAGILLDQLGGALRGAVDEIERFISKKQFDLAQEKLQVLLGRYSLGRHLTQPWQVVLAGRPNFGKSSLINALLGYERSIVFDAPGTTRDAVTAAAAIDGWPVSLADTAGLRSSTSDSLEAAGMQLARQRLAQADAVVLVFDRSADWSAADAALLASVPGAIVVHNKSDLVAPYEDRPSGLLTSALTGEGLDALQALLSRRLVPTPPAPGEAVPFTVEQHSRLLALQRFEIESRPLLVAPPK